MALQQKPALWVAQANKHMAGERLNAVNPAQGSGSTSLTFEQLEAMSYTQINSSQVLLQIAIDAGYSSIDEMLPGLEMFWDDVSALGG
jgi:hypothetical protein